nr:TonB-dependent receptor [Vibrio stylophorae]
MPIVHAEDDLLSLVDIPLSSLADTKVTSATKKAQSLSEIPAAVYIITAKEIERSGARSVADALALAPGLHVAKFSNYDWGISARSTNESLSNTLLVMVDGRSVFNPMFSGVDWDLIPVSLNNIEQIEVVLGPVGTMWGGNAVNGVINIITKEAENAPQGDISASFGNYDYQEFQLHHGIELGDYAHLSSYFEFVDHKPWTSNDVRIKDIQDFRVYTERFGARLDYQKYADTLSLQAGGIRSREDYLWLDLNPHFLKPPTPSNHIFETEMKMQEYYLGGQHLREFENGDDLETALWLTYNSNDNTARNAKFLRFDLDSHYAFNDLWSTRLTVGANVRFIDEKLGQFSAREAHNMPYLRYSLNHSDFFNQNYGLYFNWEVPLTDKAQIIVGNRWQYNNINEKIDAQPQIRLSYNIAPKQLFWMGWGRSIVTPSRLERETNFRDNKYMEDVRFSDGNNYDYYVSYLYRGNPNLKTEVVETYEMGYRLSQSDTLQLSLNGYYSIHDNIRAYQQTGAQQWIVPDGSPGTHGTVVELYTSRFIDPLWSETYGAEIAMKWRPTAALQLNANYSYKNINGHCRGAICPGNDAVWRVLENQPNHFINAQLMWDITPTLWFSSTMQYVAESKLHPDYQAVLSEHSRYIWPQVLSVDTSLSWQKQANYPQITASIENIGADQTHEFPLAVNPYTNGLQYWLTVDWNYAAMD